ncbi:MAG: tetratricopeptide repeat protein [Lachnospiraceae bacterium]|nr:tetratricopeptide repeat protein [Lachnospiraceae bacterium]
MGYRFNGERKEATGYTAAWNQSFLEREDLKLFTPGAKEWEQLHADCLLEMTDDVIYDTDGSVLIDYRQLDFLKNEKVADTINPSLNQVAIGNLTAGVFSVAGRDVIQVRGLHVGNVNFVRGKTGWIILDTLYPETVAKAAVILAEKALGENIRDHVSALLYTINATDVYSNFRGGLRGILTEEQIKNVPTYGPADFELQFTRENVYTNVVNMRRQVFQFGVGLCCDEKGSFTAGLGIGNTTRGRQDMETIKYIVEPDKPFTIDGLELECIFTKGIGAPPEMIVYFKDYRALWVSEVCCSMLHNVYALRGGQPRNANLWSKYIEDALVQFGERTDVVFQSSNWSHKNTESHPNAVREYLLHTAAMYKFIHDRTLALAGQGYRAEEIAKKLTLPEAYRHEMYTRPYYGSVPIAVRTVYNQWIGFYDGNPVNINPQTKTERAEQFVEYIGSEEAVFEKAFSDFERGRYQRASEALDLLLQYNPDNEKARYLYADCLEQLGYQSECCTWRNSYLRGAYELREGIRIPLPEKDRESKEEFLKLSKQMSADFMLDYLGIALDYEKAKDADLSFNLVIEAEGREPELHFVHIYQGALLHTLAKKKQNVPTITARSGSLMAFSKGYDHALEYITSDSEGIVNQIKDLFVDLKQNILYPILERKVANE